MNAPEFLFGSVMSTAVRLAYGLGPLIGVLGEHGIDVDPLLDEAEIPRFALEAPTYGIRIEQETAFTRSALDRLSLPNAGLTIGQRYHIATFGVLGLAASSAPTLLDMQRTLLSYPVLAWGMFEISAWRDADEATLRFESSIDLGDCHEFFLMRDLTCGVTIFRDVIGAAANPARVSFRQPKPADTAPYRSFFCCEVDFGAQRDEIRFEHETLALKPTQANDMSFRFYETQCRGLSETLSAPLNYADIVRSRLRSATPIPALPEIAHALYLTERTLQRRLAVEGASFSVLLREVRLERARELLGRENVMMDEIAYRLGFRDGVAFSRAFKTWTGVPPSRYRGGPSAAG